MDSSARDEPVAQEPRTATVRMHARSGAMSASVESDADDGAAYRADASRDNAALAHPVPPISPRSQQSRASQPMSPRAARQQGAASKPTHLPSLAQATDEPDRHTQMLRGRTLSSDDRASDDEAVPVSRLVDARPEPALPLATHRPPSQYKPPVPLARRSADPEPPPRVTAAQRAGPATAGRPQSDAAPTVHVTIGRVEVRATPAPSNNRTQPARNPREPSPLDRYLKARADGSGS
jgi:hypothetical protein